MSKMYYGSIDLSKVDKTKIVTKDKQGNLFQNGAKYLNVVVWINDTTDEYGNVASIQESVSKEDRESGVKAVYIGNLKTNDAPQQQTQAKAEAPQEEIDDDFPF